MICLAFCLEKMMPDFLNINELDLPLIERLINRSLALKQGAKSNSRHLAAANLFFENSTRTHSSFQMAENKLGWSQILIDPQASSMAKGESLLDTLKTLKAIGVDVAVVRHQQADWYQDMVQNKGYPVPHLVNAGDGNGQHPSQSLLDLVTIYQEFGHFAGLNIRITGDLRHSRVARSNAEILNRLGARLTFVAPPQWRAPWFDQYGHYAELDDDLDQQDVVMFLRVQHERITQRENQNFSVLDYHQHYGLTPARYQQLKPSAIIMHPAPVNRDVEIASDLVEAPKSRIFRQMENGVYARMAILEYVTAESR